MADRVLEVRGATQNNLRDVDVRIGPGLTAVVGVSGSGKSSLAFDTVYHEARRRFIEALSLGAPSARLRPAAVRSIDGLGPAVSIAQNVLNRNPNSLVATAVGAHPFLRLLFSRFAEVRCPHCGTGVRAVTDDERVGAATALHGPVDVPLVRGLKGSHARLLALLAARLDRAAIAVDGRPWNGRKLDPSRPHDIVVTTGNLPPSASAACVREELAQADAWGSHEVVVAGQSLLRAPICPTCHAWVPPLPATAFRPGNGPPARRGSSADTSSHTIDGRTLTEVVALTASEVMAFLSSTAIPATGKRLLDELRRRLNPLIALGLDHVALDRPMPTLSRGESQRVRLAVVVAGRLEDLLHVLDEPSVGLHRRDLERLFKALAALPGPVLMVEHDAAAIATADDVIEIGPGAGPGGGRVVFQGTPAALWQTNTLSGRFLSGRERAIERARTKPDATDPFLTIARGSARNLNQIDCSFPIGRLTAVTGPSGAGKTTLVRDVVLASAAASSPVGCETFQGPITRAIAVDQSPLGNNPRSNPATYTKAFDRIRTVFANATGESASLFTFNRSEGACASCEGMGAVEVALPYLASTWIECDACEGKRYRPEVLDLRPNIGGVELSIADALALSVDEARAVFATDKAVCRALDALTQVGLGYLALGQPSPTLSGGEAQRVRLARELARAKAGDLVVLDEPTTGLHPADLARLVAVLDALTALGCTVIVVEHQPDLVAAADWIVELGPGGGPEGGRVMHCGPPARRGAPKPSPRAQPRRRPRSSDVIRIRDASANNLKRVSVDIPKGRFTAVTGVSGSGKSSLVRDVLEAEATRRLLECLSMYERQGTHEGAEAPVRLVDGLGPTLVLASQRRSTSPRATVGSASELDRLLGLVLARGGDRHCLECAGDVVRLSPVVDSPWRCASCGMDAVPLEPRHLNPGTPIAACQGCAGLGVQKLGRVDRLVVRPDAPICGGALFSPGYFPRNYLCTEGTGGNTMLVAVAARHGFDPRTTPWNEMSAAAQHAFLQGDPEPYVIQHKYGSHPTERRWSGVMRELARWDQGGLYSTTQPCPQCVGKRLRRQYLSIDLGGFDRATLHTMPLGDLESVIAGASIKTDDLAEEARATAQTRLSFLRHVGLGYLHLDRPSATLSAGEAQRVKLASILGSRLLGMTILLDEPSRGLHPREVTALAIALEQLRDAGNTVIAVEHDGALLAHADHIIEIGPGPGARGGRVVFQGPRADAATGETATAEALAGSIAGAQSTRVRRVAPEWMEVRGASEHHLEIDALRVPLGVLVGVCGVSGSGKSTLVVDTIGLALAPPKLTTSVSIARYEPGAHDTITGAPDRTVVADQTRTGISSAGAFLGLVGALQHAYAVSDDAVAAGIAEGDFSAGCDACRGGQVVEDMGFLPSVASACEACDGTGYRAEVRSLVARGRTLPEVEARTIAELLADWGDVPAIARGCDAACRLGLGYLVVRQPGWTLSGGEAQRLKLAREVAKRGVKPTLYLLDEPTVGLHVRDVNVLATALHEVVAAGHSVLVVDHDPSLLAACDWIVELGPGAGPDGGRVIAEGTPEDVARLDTPTAPYLRGALA